MGVEKSILRQRVLWASAPWLIFYTWAYFFSGWNGLVIYNSTGSPPAPYLNLDFSPLAPERVVYILATALTIFITFVQYSVLDRWKAFLEVYESVVVFSISIMPFTDLLPLLYPGGWVVLSDLLFKPPYLVTRMIPDLVIFTVIAIGLYKKNLNTSLLVLILMNLVQFIFPPLGFPFHFWFGYSPGSLGGFAEVRVLASVFSFGIYRFWNDFQPRPKLLVAEKGVL